MTNSLTTQDIDERVYSIYNSKSQSINLGKSRQKLNQLVTSHLQSREERESGHPCRLICFLTPCLGNGTAHSRSPCLGNGSVHSRTPCLGKGIAHTRTPCLGNGIAHRRLGLAMSIKIRPFPHRHAHRPPRLDNSLLRFSP